MSNRQALYLAQQRGLDLIEVSPLARPPVCRIMDYGQYKYQESRTKAKQKAKQKKTEIKGIRLSFKMGEHDLNIRQKQAEKFLQQGDKVKIELILRGREHAHKDLAWGKIQNFITALGEDIEIEQEITKKGNRMSTIVYKKK